MTARLKKSNMCKNPGCGNQTPIRGTYCNTCNAKLSGPRWSPKFAARVAELEEQKLHRRVVAQKSKFTDEYLEKIDRINKPIEVNERTYKKDMSAKNALAELYGSSGLNARDLTPVGSVRLVGSDIFVTLQEEHELVKILPRIAELNKEMAQLYAADEERQRVPCGTGAKKHEIHDEREPLRIERDRLLESLLHRDLTEKVMLKQLDAEQLNAQPEHVCSVWRSFVSLTHGVLHLRHVRRMNDDDILNEIRLKLLDKIPLYRDEGNRKRMVEIVDFVRPFLRTLPHYQLNNIFGKFPRWECHICGCDTKKNPLFCTFDRDTAEKHLELGHELPENVARLTVQTWLDEEIAKSVKLLHTKIVGETAPSPEIVMPEPEPVIPVPEAPKPELAVQIHKAPNPKKKEPERAYDITEAMVRIFNYNNAGFQFGVRVTRGSKQLIAYKWDAKTKKRVRLYVSPYNDDIKDELMRRGIKPTGAAENL